MKSLIQLLPLLAVFAVFMLLVVLPARKRQRAVSEFQEQLAVGDSVVTSGGVFGTIARLADDRVGVEIADGIVVDVARPAIVGKGA